MPCQGPAVERGGSFLMGAVNSEALLQLVVLRQS